MKIDGLPLTSKTSSDCTGDVISCYIHFDNESKTIELFFPPNYLEQENKDDFTRQKKQTKQAKQEEEIILVPEFD